MRKLLLCIALFALIAFSTVSAAGTEPKDTKGTDQQTGKTPVAPPTTHTKEQPPKTPPTTHTKEQPSKGTAPVKAGVTIVLNATQPSINSTTKLMDGDTVSFSKGTAKKAQSLYIDGATIDAALKTTTFNFNDDASITTLRNNYSIIGLNFAATNKPDAPGPVVLLTGTIINADLRIYNIVQTAAAGLTKPFIDASGLSISNANVYFYGINLLDPIEFITFKDKTVKDFSVQLHGSIGKSVILTGGIKSISNSLIYVTSAVFADPSVVIQTDTTCNIDGVAIFADQITTDPAIPTAPAPIISNTDGSCTIKNTSAYVTNVVGEPTTADTGVGFGIFGSPKTQSTVAAPTDLIVFLDLKCDISQVELVKPVAKFNYYDLYFQTGAKMGGAIIKEGKGDTGTVEYNTATDVSTTMNKALCNGSPLSADSKKCECPAGVKNPYCWGYDLNGFKAIGSTDKACVADFCPDQQNTGGSHGGNGFSLNYNNVLFTIIAALLFTI